MQRPRLVLLIVAIVILGWLASAGIAALVTAIFFGNGYRVVEHGNPAPRPEGGTDQAGTGK